MSYFDESLDALAFEVAAAVSHPARCNCARCRQRAHERVVHGSGCGCGCGGAESFDETTRRRSMPRLPPVARRQTSIRARGTQLPGWRGWSHAVTLQEIIAARPTALAGGAVSARLRPFFARGPQVYRITRVGLDRNRPLSIGSTKNVNSIADRIIEHYRQRSRADINVYNAIHNLREQDIMVQAARLTRQGMHPRRARNYEGWLQDRERPLLYDPNSTTFDEAARRNPAPTGGYNAW